MQFDPLKRSKILGKSHMGASTKYASINRARSLTVIFNILHPIHTQTPRESKAHVVNPNELLPGRGLAAFLVAVAAAELLVVVIDIVAGMTLVAIVVTPNRLGLLFVVGAAGAWLIVIMLMDSVVA